MTNHLLELDKVTATSVEGRTPNCVNCQKQMSIWSVIKDKSGDTIDTCLDCHKFFVEQLNSDQLKTIISFFNVAFYKEVKIIRIKDFLLVSFKNQRTIEGGLISLKLELQYVQNIVSAGVPECVINKAVAFSVVSENN